MMDAEQNAFRLPDELMRAFDSTWKGFASAFGRLPEKIERPEANVKTDYSSEGSRPSQENAHVILRTCSDPILGDGASMTNQKDGCLTLKIRPKSQTKSGRETRSLSPDRCNRLSAFYNNLGVVNDVDNLEASLARERYEIAVAEVRAGEQKLHKCYDEVCSLKRQLKKTKADKVTLSTVVEVQAIEKKISARMITMNKIDQQVAHARDKIQELSVSGGFGRNTDKRIPDIALPKPPRARSSSPTHVTHVSWHPSV
jgi:hypothetical protein